MVGSGLEKLKLIAYAKPDYSGQVGEMTAEINPASLSLSLGICFTDETAAGGTGRAKAFNRALGATLGFELVFDGTGAVPDSGDDSVAKQLSQLRKLALEINPDTHGPNYVKIVWGDTLFKGRLKTIAIDYNLFNPDGSPLRAKAKLSFVGFQEKRETGKELSLNSPDMSHIVTVMPDDTLPLLCDRIYGDSGYYIKVAEANDLTDLRGLAVGSQLVFPPLAGPSS